MSSQHTDGLNQQVSPLHGILSFAAPGCGLPAARSPRERQSFGHFRVRFVLSGAGAALACAVGVACGIRVAHEPEGCTVHLDGRLTASQVDELLRACADATRPIRIDLAGLRSLDATAFEVIQRLVASGVELVGVPWYLRHQTGPAE